MLKYVFIISFIFVSSGAAPNGNTSIETTLPDVCYPDVDCFSLNGPMGHLGILPETPELVGTRFFAYTSSSLNHPREIQPKNRASFQFLDPTKRLVFLIHGFDQSSTDATLQKLMKSLLRHTSDVGTVIMVDWQRGALVGAALGHPESGWHFHWELALYPFACVNTQLVGRQITFLVERLRVHGKASPANVYLIGFSLGAQVAGFAGKRSIRKYGWTYSRITGLDAAMPFFEGHPGSHLTRTDATFVDSIHTNGGFAGFSSAFAKVDFIVNGGSQQPKCDGKRLHDLGCDHRASVEYFEVSIRQKDKCPFWACPSDSESCSKPDTRLGYYADEHSGVSGKRFVNTKRSPPECSLLLGDNSTPSNVLD